MAKRLRRGWKKNAYRRGVDAAGIRHVRALVRKGDCFAAEAFMRSYPVNTASWATMRRLRGMVARCKYVPPPPRWMPATIYK